MSVKPGLLALLAGLMCGPALAQLPPELIERSPLELATEAFEADYGRKLVDNLAKILRESANPACVQERAIRAHRWADEARAILVRRGSQMLHVTSRIFNTERFAIALQAQAGAGAKAEIVALMADPAVKELRALDQPARLAIIADQIVETADRYTLLNRFHLNGRISPLASGDEALLRANPAEKANEAAEAYIRQSSSTALKRWLELDTAVAQAAVSSHDMDAALRLGPSQMMAGMDEDLAALCIERRR